VDKVQSDPQAKEAFLAALKSATAGFGLLGPDATVTQNSATLGSSGDETTKSGGSSSNVPLIAGIAGGVVLVAAVAVFLVTRSRRQDDRQMGDASGTGPQIGRRSSRAMADSHKRQSAAGSNDLDNRVEEELDMAIFSNPTYSATVEPVEPASSLYANDGVDDDDNSYDSVPSRVMPIYSSYDEPVAAEVASYSQPEVQQDGGYLDVNEEDAGHDGTEDQEHEEDADDSSVSRTQSDDESGEEGEHHVVQEPEFGGYDESEEAGDEGNASQAELDVQDDDDDEDE
jgi:hypothetical protein